MPALFLLNKHQGYERPINLLANRRRLRAVGLVGAAKSPRRGYPSPVRGTRHQRAPDYAVSGLLSVRVDRWRRFPTRMYTLIINTHAGKMSVNHTLKLTVNSSISARA